MYDVGIEGMIYNYQTYYFDKNTLGDIVAIRNQRGEIEAKYEYDAWGKVTVMNENGIPTMSEGSIGNINPFRYRGYYYDSETGFYYLQTRYYDPEICRFINADDYELIATLSEIPGQLNLYAYCNNNPIMYTDETGEFVLTSFLIGLGIAMAIGAGVGATAYVGTVVVEGISSGSFEWNWADALAATVGGAIGGAFAYMPWGGALYAGAFASGFSTSLLSDVFNNAFYGTEYDVGESFGNAVKSGLLSFASAGLMDTSFAIQGISYGRGSWGATSKQIYTKFRRGQIKGISAKTFGKMFGVSFYESLLDMFLVD